MGSTASSSITKALKGDEIFIPAKCLYENLLVFVHNETGEVIILAKPEERRFLNSSESTGYSVARYGSCQKSYWKDTKLHIHFRANEYEKVLAPAEEPPSSQPLPSSTSESSTPVDPTKRKPMMDALAKLRKADSDSDLHNSNNGAKSEETKADMTDPQLKESETPTQSSNQRQHQQQLVSGWRSQPYDPPIVQFMSASQSQSQSQSQQSQNSQAKEPVSSLAQAKSGGFDSKDEHLPAFSKQSRKEEPLEDLVSPQEGCSFCPSCHQTFDHVINCVSFREHTERCTRRVEMMRSLKDISRTQKAAFSQLVKLDYDKQEKILNDAFSYAQKKINDLISKQFPLQKLIQRAMKLNEYSSYENVITLKEDLIAQKKTFQDCLDDGSNQRSSGNHGRSLEEIAVVMTILEETCELLEKKRALLKTLNTTPLRVKDFRFRALLGKGGFASVYLATRVSSGKLCAIKVMKKEQFRIDKSGNQALRERKVMACTNSKPDYFVRLLGAFHQNNYMFLVMEYMHGGDCYSLLSSHKQLPVFVARHLVAQVSLAVKHLHLHGVIHRDIKPDNVMITYRGQAKLGDFGLVTAMKPRGSENSSLEDPDNSDLLYAGGKPRGKSINWDPSVPDQDGPSALMSIGRGVSDKAAARKKKMLQDWRQQVENSTTDETGHWLEEDSYRTLSRSVEISNHSSGSIVFFKPASDRLTSMVGNYTYWSPEMVKGNYDHNVDWWAVGVLLFHLLAGTPPFSEKGDLDGSEEAMNRVQQNILSHTVQWNKLPVVSEECRGLLEGILLHSEYTRLGCRSADQILLHPFFDGIDYNTIHEGYGPMYPRIPKGLLIGPLHGRSPDGNLSESKSTDSKSSIDSSKGDMSTKLEGLPIFTLLTDDEKREQFHFSSQVAPVLDDNENNQDLTDFSFVLY